MLLTHPKFCIENHWSNVRIPKRKVINPVAQFGDISEHVFKKFSPKVAWFGHMTVVKDLHDEAAVEGLAKNKYGGRNKSRIQEGTPTQ